MSTDSTKNSAITCESEKQFNSFQQETATNSLKKQILENLVDPLRKKDKISGLELYNNLLVSYINAIADYSDVQIKECNIYNRIRFGKCRYGKCIIKNADLREYHFKIMCKAETMLGFSGIINEFVVSDKEEIFKCLLLSGKQHFAKVKFVKIDKNATPNDYYLVFDESNLTKYTDKLKTKMSLKTKLKIMKKFTYAIETLHAMKLWHGNIKRYKMFFKDDDPFFVGFKNSVCCTSIELGECYNGIESLTRKETYMSSDLYSLGVIFYELLCEDTINSYAFSINHYINPSLRNLIEKLTETDDSKRGTISSCQNELNKIIEIELLNFPSTYTDILFTKN